MRYSENSSPHETADWAGLLYGADVIGTHGANGLARISQASGGSLCCCLGSGAIVPEQPAGRLSAGETGTETETDVSPQCLAAVADPGVVPLFPSRPSQPTL